MKSIEIINLSKTIKDREVLRNITITFEKGKIHGIFGRNGSGKTMLFRAVCGLIKPTTGSIRINGKMLNKDISFPDSIGVIIESPGFWNEYSGFENLKTLASIKSQITDIDIMNAIERVGLISTDKRIFKKYSLGMKQRLAVAQAIMEKPEIIVLDEPTNSLDDEGIELVRKILLEEKSRGATILIASHNKDDIDILADYKYKMSDGELYTI